MLTTIYIIAISDHSFLHVHFQYCSHWKLFFGTSQPPPPPDTLNLMTLHFMCHFTDTMNAVSIRWNTWSWWSLVVLKLMEGVSTVSNVYRDLMMRSRHLIYNTKCGVCSEMLFLSLTIMYHENPWVFSVFVVVLNRPTSLNGHFNYSGTIMWFATLIGE